MFAQSKLARLVGVSILSSSVMASAAVSAADLPCVIRAINWNNGGSATISNHVNFTTVALHSNGIAAFATGSLTNLKCSAAPFGIGLQNACTPTLPAR